MAVAAGVVRPGIEANDLLRPYATDRTAKSPSMRAEWSNCWWMACVTDEHANRHALKPDMDDHQSFKSIYGQLIVVLGTETLYRTAVSSI